MFIFDKNGRMNLEFEASEAWMLYFLFAYLDAPPTDETLELFEAAHDRAMDSFSDPNLMLEHLLAKAKSAERADYVALQRRWHRFRERYADKSKQELLDVIAFFLNEEPGLVCLDTIGGRIDADAIN
jgi:hypothetical protein